LYNIYPAEQRKIIALYRDVVPTELRNTDKMVFDIFVTYILVEDSTEEFVISAL
jgi:hypothetical protein